MREEWYGDPRDLVKWGTLVHLARYDSIRTIIQVAFFRVSERPQLESDGHKWRVADEVWRHFRDLGSIRQLTRANGIEHDHAGPWHAGSLRTTWKPSSR